MRDYRDLIRNVTLIAIIYLIFALPIVGRADFFWWDTYLRLEASDAPLTTFYFFWTNFFYLPSLFSFVIAWLFTLYVSNNWSLVNAFGVLLLFPATSELYDVIAANHTLCLNDFVVTTPNLLLSNFLNSYHPFVLYVGIGMVTLAVLLVQLIILQGSGLANIWLRSQTFCLSRQAVYWTFTALSLGSWWAFQEGTWGGWWNWDPSETFGLLFLLISLLPWHLRTSPNVNLNESIYLNISLQSTAAVYFFIQLNFELVSHNFGIQFFYFFNNNLFLLQATTFLTFWTWGRQSITMVCSITERPSSIVPKDAQKLILLSLIFALLLTTTLSSFQSLSHNFLQKFLFLNCGNGDLIFSNLNLVLIPYFLIFFTLTNLYQATANLLLTPFLPNPLLPILGLSHFPLTQASLFHISIWTFLVLNLLAAEPTSPSLSLAPLTTLFPLSSMPSIYNDFNVTLIGGGIQFVNCSLVSNTFLPLLTSELSNPETTNSTNLFWLWISTTNLTSSIQVVAPVTGVYVSIAYNVTSNLFLLILTASLNSHYLLRPHLLNV